MAELRDVLASGDVANINLGGTETKNAVLTRGTANPTNKITVGNDNSDFARVKDALDSITDSAVDNRYVIIVSPGSVVEQNPIQAKSYVTVISEGMHVSELVANNPNQDLFYSADEFHLIGFSLKNVTGVSNYAFNHSISGEITVKDCIITDCSNGILINNSGATANIENLTVETPNLATGYAINVLSGTVLTGIIRATNTANVTTLAHVDGINSYVTIDALYSLGPNVGTIIDAKNGCDIRVFSADVHNCTDGVVVSGTGTMLRLANMTIRNVTNDGLRADNVGTNITISLFSVSITGSGNLNLNLLNPSTYLVGNGFTEINKFYAHEDAELYAYLLDTTTDDEGLNIVGELHVGTPTRPTESVFGEGDSYTHGMLVYTYDGQTYIDVTADLSSASGSIVPPPNGNVNTAFYFTSTMVKNNDFLKHYGIKLKQTKAGGSLDHDVTVTGATSPTTAAGDYNRRSDDYNNNSVYVRLDGAYWLFNKQGYWCLNDASPEDTINYFNSNYISTTLENTYNGTGINTGTPLVELGSDSVTQYFAFEYYNEEQLSWIEFDIMETMSSSPYAPIEPGDVIGLAGSFQIRYDMNLKDSAWGKTDDMSLGTSYYWIRARIINQLLFLPEFEQVKIHSNRMELNGDGWPEYFGTARPVAVIPWDLGMLRPANSSPGNQDLYVADSLGVGRVENLLVGGNIDRLGFNAYLPLDMDTSTGLYIRFSFIGTTTSTGDVKFVLRWGYTKDGEEVFTSTTNAPTDGPNQKSEIIIHTMAGVDQVQETIQTKLPVSGMVSRRVGSTNVGFGDTLWMTLERTGNDVLDTYIGNIAVINIQPLYLKWCDGGHI